MPDPNVVIDALETLSAAGLDYTPRGNVERLVEVYLAILSEFPDWTIRQAVIEYLRSEQRWPNPARFREKVEQVWQAAGRREPPRALPEVVFPDPPPGLSWQAAQDWAAQSPEFQAALAELDRLAKGGARVQTAQAAV